MAPLKNAHLFASAPDWAAYVASHPDVIPAAVTPPMSLEAVRAKQAEDVLLETKWAAAHPSEDYGYRKWYKRIEPTGTSVAVYLPLEHTDKDQPLPILFVTHGGGYLFGSALTDEQWFLYGLLSQSQTRFAVVSVDYKLAPEYPHPVAQEECWEVLKRAANDVEAVFEISNVDCTKILLAGSSAGAGLAAYLAQQSRDAGLKQVIGAVLNVPMLCHPDVFPKEQFEQGSYDQCQDGSESNLRAKQMHQMWDWYVPAATRDARIKASPFLGNTKQLPPHAIFVAGQDPLRDEGLAYAEKLRSDGVSVELHVYQGVPHNFAKIWELDSRQKFHEQLAQFIDQLVNS